MTDDESRKAFETHIMTAFSAANRFIVLAVENGAYTFSDMQTQWEDWQASAEYHTKRERERCAAIARLIEASEDNHIQRRLAAALIRADIEQPKP